MRGILIDENWWRIVDPKDTEELKSLLGAERLERPAIKIAGHFFGCYCDADARTKGYGQFDTVMMLVRKRFWRRSRVFGYVAGPVFIHLNKGLDDADIEIIKDRIQVIRGGDYSTHLVVDNYQDMSYEDTDP